MITSFVLFTPPHLTSLSSLRVRRLMSCVERGGFIRRSNMSRRPMRRAVCQQRAPAAAAAAAALAAA